MQKGTTHSEETRQKMRLAKLGKKRWPHTQETKRKMSLAQKGRPRRSGWHHSDESKQKIRQALAGRPSGRIPWNKGRTGVYSRAVRRRMSRSAKGKRLSDSTRRKISEGLSGPKSPRWRGGITEENHKIRTSLQYRLWRDAVFARDGYQCVIGGKAHGSDLEADHIKPFARFPELRLEVSNGRTLCKTCHRKTDTWGKKSAA